MTSITVYQVSETCDRFRGEGRMKTVLRMDIHIHSEPCRREEVDEAGKKCSVEISSLGTRHKYFETYFMRANTNLKCSGALFN